MVDWSLLPKDLLDSIAKRNGSPTDLVRLRSVCSSWRSFISIETHHLAGGYPFIPNDGVLDAAGGFKLYKRTVFLISAPNVCCRTNPDAWLIKFEENATDRKAFLNPLSRFKIKSLPHEFPKQLDVSEFPIMELGQEYVLRYTNPPPLLFSFGDDGGLYMEKVLFMHLGLQSDDFVLLTIHISGKLAIFKSIERRWTIIHDMPLPYDDVVIFNDTFYAVDSTGRAVIVDPNSTLSVAGNPVFGGEKKYLVVSRGELLLVDAYLSMVSDQDSYFSDDFAEDNENLLYERPTWFNVFKLDMKGKEWHEVKCLGDLVLFLGDDCAFSASASDLPICKGNCIIFTHHLFCACWQDMDAFEDHIRVYDLDDGKIFSLTDHPDYSKLFWPPPDWVIPATREVRFYDSIILSDQLLSS